MSLCRYCSAEIVWVARPGGGWWPPFDADPKLTEMEYEVSWVRLTGGTGDWVATPAEADVKVTLRRHACVERTQALNLDRLVRGDDREPDRPPLPSPLAPPPPVRAVEVKVQPTPEQWIKVARRLYRSCPTCLAPRWEWCTYVRGDDFGQPTRNLHTSRKDH